MRLGIEICCRRGENGALIRLRINRLAIVGVFVCFEIRSRDSHFDDRK